MQNLGKVIYLCFPLKKRLNINSVECFSNGVAPKGSVESDEKISKIIGFRLCGNCAITQTHIWNCTFFSILEHCAYIDLFTCMPHKFDQFVKQYRQRWYPHTMRNTQNRSHFIHCISVTKNVLIYLRLFNTFLQKSFCHQK